MLHSQPASNRDWMLPDIDFPPHFYWQAGWPRINSINQIKPYITIESHGTSQISI